MRHHRCELVYPAILEAEGKLLAAAFKVDIDGADPTIDDPKAEKITDMFGRELKRGKRTLRVAPTWYIGLDKSCDWLKACPLDIESDRYIRTRAGDSFVEGNHLGTWDIALEYKLKPSEKLRAYTQWLWEDGSGIGKMNGFDGLWRLEYATDYSNALITGAVIEYIDFTNQSGPIHWTPNDHEGTPITSHSSGADDYYNNYIYNGWQNRGMSIGSPFVKSPLYNQDGYMRYRDNVLRGFHAAITGKFNYRWGYALMASYRKAWGTPIIPRAGSVDDFSMMLASGYDISRGWSIRAEVAMDRGSLYGNNWGAALSISYNGEIKIKNRR